MLLFTPGTDAKVGCSGVLVLNCGTLVHDAFLSQAKKA
jgi:hypothetical protein